MGLGERVVFRGRYDLHPFYSTMYIATIYWRKEVSFCCKSLISDLLHTDHNACTKLLQASLLLHVDNLFKVVSMSFAIAFGAQLS